MSIILKQVLDLLNGALEQDPKAIQELFSARAICNDELAKHPLIPVKTIGKTDYIRTIGIINGILGAIGEKQIATEVVLDSSGNPKLVSFCIYINNHET